MSIEIAKLKQNLAELKRDLSNETYKNIRPRDYQTSPFDQIDNLSVLANKLILLNDIMQIERKIEDAYHLQQLIYPIDIQISPLLYMKETKITIRSNQHTVSIPNIELEQYRFGSEDILKRYADILSRLILEDLKNQITSRKNFNE